MILTQNETDSIFPTENTTITNDGFEIVINKVNFVTDVDSEKGNESGASTRYWIKDNGRVVGTGHLLMHGSTVLPTAPFTLPEKGPMEYTELAKVLGALGQYARDNGFDNTNYFTELKKKVEANEPIKLL
jgi:hypothetical protein